MNFHVAVPPFDPATEREYQTDHVEATLPELTSYKWIVKGKGQVRT